jgi:hypothetical protein
MPTLSVGQPASTNPNTSKTTGIHAIKMLFLEPVPKLIDCALPRTVLGQALAVFQAFSLAVALQNREFQGCFPKN